MSDIAHSPTLPSAQTPDGYEAEKTRALQLCDENKFVQALPILEKLNSTNPNDVVVLERLAVALVGYVATLDDVAARKKALVRARGAAQRANELGNNSNAIKVLLDRIAPDGSEAAPPLSSRKEVEDAINQAEAAFATGNFDRAITGYERAHTLDPKLYEAPLFLGDVYFKMNEPEIAGEWYAKAIAIDPNRETAYRYWGDVLMKTGKLREAHPKFIDAIIGEPYNRAVYSGVNQWAEQAGVRPSHPQIAVPEFKRGEDGKTTINIDAGTLLGKEQDGSKDWLVYSIVRASWSVGNKFAKAYPNEKEYRHNLAEESEALRLVADSVAKKVKSGEIDKLNPSMAMLVKLVDGGLLEAYILLARADEGIARDYAAYRETHRDELRRYLTTYVLPNVKQ